MQLGNHEFLSLGIFEVLIMVITVMPWYRAGYYLLCRKIHLQRTLFSIIHLSADFGHPNSLH